jgi:hypothetical protein
MLIRLLDKIHREVSARKRTKFCAHVERSVPGYERFISDRTAAHAIGTSSNNWRAVDILKVLQGSRPRSIVELGSGSSTALFAHYVKTNPGSTLLSVDESEDWAALTQSGSEKNGFLPHHAVTIRSAARVENDLGSFYQTELPEKIDLLYIDGPSVKRTATRQLANQDVIHLFDRGIRPKSILVDRRQATVRATDPRHLLKFGALNFNSMFTYNR